MSEVTDRSATGPLPVVWLILPRQDHHGRYRHLARALHDSGELRTIVVTGLDARWPSEQIGVPAMKAHFYCEPGTRVVAWLAFVVRRELRARFLFSRVPPSLIVVPSDVSDALSPFVEGARRRGIPVVYAQGAVLPPNYPARNAAVDNALVRRESRSVRWARTALDVILRRCGVHVVLGPKGVLGANCDRAFVMDESQAEVHRNAGVLPQRIVVTGAPFIDELIDLRNRFDSTARERLRSDLDLGTRRVVTLFTQSLFRLKYATRDAHDSVVRDTLAVVRHFLPDWRCVIKPHPMEAVEDYRALVAEAADVRVTKDTPADELVLLSDLVISLGTTSPSQVARMLGVPVLILNPIDNQLFAAHSDAFVPGTVLRTTAELARVLETVERDADALGELCGDYRSHQWIDGHASTRIANHIRDLVRQGSQGSPSSAAAVESILSRESADPPPAAHVQRRSVR